MELLLGESVGDVDGTMDIFKMESSIEFNL